MKRLFWFAFPLALLTAETGQEAWLRYRPVPGLTTPATLTVVGDSEVLRSARDELIRGVRGMTGRVLRLEAQGGAITIGVKEEMPEDAFRLKSAAGRITVSSSNDRGTLYGVFALLRRMQMRQPLAGLDEKQVPHSPLRWVNEWANLDGTIERGYAGPSPFWEKNNLREDLTRAGEYARLLASLGVNGITVNNVNANPRVITTEFLPQVARLASVFRPWGVRIGLAIDFSSPQTVGKLDTFDPLDPRVIEFWRAKVDEIYAAVPDLAGFVLKADSEGRLGPSAYKRTHADAANVIARPLKKHGGTFFYRGFVYDHRMDWRNLKNDRARAAYDNFIHLDGQFEDNVLLQIKHGPIDFQVREPASPLFEALKKTRRAIELQITQEYFGQARHMVYLVPMWKTVMDFDPKLLSGFVGVSNVGMDLNWTGHPLSQANLYGYGRLAWDPTLTSERITDEWVRLTFGHDPLVVKTISAMQLRSWRVFENYTGPLGAQTLTAIAGNHYGPEVESSERNGWGQWHRADEKGMGMDRTVKTGTGFAGQYKPELAAKYESLETCPDELLLWFHHVPYTHRLKSGKTVIQHIYDTHYEGAMQAGEYVRDWKLLEGRIDEGRYLATLERLEYQAGHTEVWRDAIVYWFHKTSGIADEKGRAGNYPGRVEAEGMDLEGYKVVDVRPWEAASASKAVECPEGTCAASTKFTGAPGVYSINVRYFDVNHGVGQYRLLVGAQVVEEWRGDDWFPTRRIDSHSSTRRLVKGLTLKTGDVIRVEGTRGGGEGAALDYIEFRRTN